MNNGVGGYEGNRRVKARWATRRGRATRAAGDVGGDGTAGGQDPPNPTYADWVARYDTPDDAARRAVESQLAKLADQPTISVVVPVFDTPEVLLHAALDSVVRQWYSRWELCIVDDGSTASWVSAVLDEYGHLDQRIRVITHGRNRHISAASNSGVEHTTGQFVAVLDHDDLLAPHALAEVVLALAAHPDAGLVYSDEDHLDQAGHRRDPYFKPDFDPVLLLAQNYVAHLCVVRRDVVEAISGFREGFEGSQDWDLVLRAVERLRPEQVVHIPRVLYHWRAHAGSTANQTSQKAYAIEAGRRSVADHLRRIGVAGAVRTTSPTGFTRVLWDATASPRRVSIVMAAVTGDPLMRAVDSVLARTTWPDSRLLVVLGGDEPPEVVRFLDQHRGHLDIVSAPVDGGSVAAAAAPCSSGPVRPRRTARCCASSTTTSRC